MGFKNLCRIVDCYGNNGTSGLGGDLKASFMEGKEFQFIVSFVSGAFRKDTDGYAVFHFLYGGQYSLQPFFDVLSVQKETMKIPHPVRKKRNGFHFFFGDIACRTRTENIGEENIKITPVVSDI